MRHRALGWRIPSTGEQSPHHQETLCVADTPPAAPPQVSLALPRPPIGRLSPNQPMSEPEGGGIFPQPGICTNGQNLVCAGHCRKLSVFARARTALLCRDAKTQARPGSLWETVANLMNKICTKHCASSVPLQPLHKWLPGIITQITHSAPPASTVTVRTIERCSSTSEQSADADLLAVAPLVLSGCCGRVLISFVCPRSCSRAAACLCSFD